MSTVTNPWTADSGWINSSEWINSSYEWITTTTQLSGSHRWTNPDANSSELISSTVWWSSSTDWFNSTVEPGGSTPRQFPPPPLYLFVIKCIVCSVFLFVSFFGNLLVCYAMATTKKLRSYNNYFIFGLAVADLVSGGVVPSMLNIIWLVDYWPFSEAFCTVLMFADHVFLHATFLMTLIICIDRYRALYHPVKHMTEKTLRHACLMMSISFVIPVLFWTPLIVVLPYTGVTERIRPPLCHPSHGLHPGLLILALLVLSWVPILATTILYAFIYCAIIRRTREHKKQLVGKESFLLESRTVIRKTSNRKVNRESSLNSPLERVPTPGNPDIKSSSMPPSTTAKRSSRGSVNLAFKNDKGSKISYKSKTGEEPVKETAPNFQPLPLSPDRDIPVERTPYVSVGNVNLAFIDEEKGSISSDPQTKQLAVSAKFQASSMSPSTSMKRSHSVPIRKVNLASEEEQSEHINCELRTGQGESIRKSAPIPKSVIAKPHLAKHIGRKASLVSLRATRTLTYIWVVMVVSGMPWSVYALIGAIAQEHTPDTDTGLLSFLAHLSSAANPFCYAICNPLFKRAFKRILCCRRCRRSPSSARANGQEMNRRAP